MLMHLDLVILPDDVKLKQNTRPLKAFKGDRDQISRLSEDTLL
jgi:hypothetical protein